MPRFAKDAEGNLKVYDENRARWRDAAAVDVELARQPLLRGATAAAEGITGLPGLGTPGLREATTNSNPLLNTALELGTIGAGVVGLGAMGTKAAIGGLRGGTRMAQRVQQAARPSPMMQTMAEQTTDEIGGVVSNFGMDSAGAAAQGGMWEFLKSRPALRGTLEGLEDFIGTSRPLTADQSRLLASGNAERLGFQWLPGQRAGNNVISDIMRSQPFMADALDPVVQANARQLNKLTAQAVDLTEDQMGRGALAGSRGAVGQRFEDVAARMPEVTLPESVVANVEKALTSAERQAYGISRAVEGTERALSVQGRDLMQLRQKVAEEASNRASKEGQDVVQREFAQTVDAIDDAIESALRANGDDTTMALWQEARTRWRVVRALDRPGVVQPDGSISMKSLSLALEKEFDREFRRQLSAPADFPQDVRDLLDYTRLARAFESNLGNSGTATRSAMGDIINSPVRYAKQRAAAKFVSDVILNTPETAARLP